MSDAIKTCDLGIGCIAYESCDDGQCVVREAIAEEREACAKIADSIGMKPGDYFVLAVKPEEIPHEAAAKIAAAIRARGQTT